MQIILMIILKILCAMGKKLSDVMVKERSRQTWNMKRTDIRRKMQYILNMRPVFNKEALFSVMEQNITEVHQNQKQEIQ